MKIIRQMCLILLIFAMITLTACEIGKSQVADVQIGNITIEESNSNKSYGNLMFNFSNKDGDDFSCIVTGIGNINELSEQEQNDIANNIGGHFAAGSKTQIQSTENCKLIDAEKYAGKPNKADESFGDSSLCWAASAADMLVYAGWTDNDEDTVMSEFTDNYKDEGAFQDVGIKFFFNGINPDQVASEKAGKDSCKDAIFEEKNSDDDGFFSSTQVRHPGTSKGLLVNHGQVNDYAAECVYDKMYASTKNESVMADSIMKAVDEGDAVGMQLLFYKDESRIGVHAITCFGYIKDANNNLKALIISDSDNDVKWGKRYSDSTNETLSDRQAKPNTYDMFLTDSFTHNEVNYIALKDYKYSNPKFKYTDSVIHGITILKSRKNADKVKESGTGDAANTPDAVAVSARFSELETSLSVKSGKEFKMPFIISNTSYKGFAAKDKPYAKCRYIFFKDGKKVGEQSFEVAFVTDDYKTGEANCNFSVENPYTLNAPGKYMVDVEILGVYSKNTNKKIQEAFYSNNYLKNAGTVTVK